MKHILSCCFLITCFLYSGCTAQPKTVKLSDVRFESIFGYSKDSSVVYCLLGSGFFRAPRADYTDSLINVWMNRHPNGVLMLVSALKNDKSKMVYCWAVDGKDTLNTFIIRSGCYPGGTMVSMQKNSSIAEVYISNNDYQKFIEQLKSAETFAKENKLGIWGRKDLYE